MSEKEKLDIKESKELLKSLKMLGLTAGKVMKDGKVDLADLSHLVDLAKDLDDLLAGFKGLDKLDDEVKDLDETEVMELVMELYKSFKEIKEAFKKEADVQ